MTGQQREIFPAAMTLARALSRLLKPAERLLDALTDPARRERTVVGVLAAYVVVWTLYGVLAKASQDVHFDMAEMVAWSRELAFGYPKHPPLAAWIVAAWFAVFPVSDWAFYLLAMMVAASALWLAWRLAGDYLDGDKRAAGFALLMLIPFFNFQALKFNANTVLLPLWAATALCFLRSYETRSAAWAALAGLCAAGAMLGKYWSVFLLAGLGVAALIDRRRAVYFRSAAPWITVAVGAVALLPHIVWLAQHDFVAFSYAAAGHVRSFASAVVGVAGYLLGALGYVAVPLLLGLAAARPGRPALIDTLWPSTPQRHLAAVAFWAPLLLPAVIAPWFSIEITSLWTMSAWTLLPVVLLSSPQVALNRQAVVAIVAFAVVLPPLMVAAAPMVATAVHRAGVTPAAAHARLLAERVTHEWRQTIREPLRLVGGDQALAYGVAFYLPDRPSTFPDFDRRSAPWADDTRVEREGVAIVCFAESAQCVTGAAARASAVPASRRIEVEVSRSYVGAPGGPGRYVIVTIPPRR